MRRRVTTLLGLVIAMMVALTPASLAGTGEQFTAPLSGDQVVPGPGDPDGGGGVFVAMGRKTGTFCFFADTTNISAPLTAAHLHRGLRGEAGEMLVELHGPSNDPDVSGCHDVGPHLARDIIKHRDRFYIEIHNEEFADGAIRAQLD